MKPGKDGAFVATAAQRRTRMRPSEDVFKALHDACMRKFALRAKRGEKGVAENEVGWNLSPARCELNGFRHVFARCVCRGGVSGKAKPPKVAQRARAPRGSVGKAANPSRVRGHPTRGLLHK